MSNPRTAALRGLLAAGRAAADPAADADLLRRYVTDRDEVAFAALVHRHAALVWHVCRQILRHDQDAEDAFQATFLVLARKAPSVRRAGSIAAFLHGVALRLALKARQAAARRRARQLTQGEPTGDTAADVALCELQTILAEEVEALPAKLRAPFILCVLEGTPRADAVNALRLKDGTLSTRLAEARVRLRERLGRRGVLFAAVVTTIDLSRLAAVPHALLERAVRSAMGQASASVLALAAGQAVGSKLLISSAVLVAAAVIGMAVAAGPSEPPKKAAAPPAARSAEDTTPRLDAFGDPLPPGALTRLGTTRFRSDEPIHSFFLTPDGKWIVLHTLRPRSPWRFTVLDARTGKQTGSLTVEVHNEQLTGATLSGDGSRLVFILKDGSRMRKQGGGLVPYVDLVVIDMTTGKEMARRAVPLNTRLASHPDGKAVAVATNNEVTIYDFATFRPQTNWQTDEGPIHALAFVAGTNELATMHGRYVRVWDTGKRQVVRSNILPGAERDWSGIYPEYAVSPDGRYVAVRSATRDFVCDLTTGRQIFEPRAPIVEFAVAPGGRYLAARDGQGKVSVYDTGTRKELYQLDFRTWSDDWALGQLAFTPDGRTLTGLPFESRAIQRWDAATGTPATDGPECWPARVLFSRDGREAVVEAVVQRDWPRLFRWDTASGKLLGVSPNPKREHMATSPDGRRVVFRHYEARSELSLVDVDTNRVEWSVRSAGEVRSCCFSLDSKLLAVQGEHGVAFWDLATFRKVRDLELKLRSNDRLRHSFAATQTLLICDYDSFRLIDLDTGAERGLSPRTGIGYYNTLTPDGRTLVITGTGAEMPPVRAWDIASGKELPLPELSPPPDPQRPLGPALRPFAFAPDGRSFACRLEARYDGKAYGDETRKVLVYEWATGERRRAIETPLEAVNLYFAPRGDVLATTHFDTTTLLWGLWDLSLQEQHEAARLTDQHIRALWQELLGNATPADRAMRLLTAVPDRTVALVRANVKPVVFDAAPVKELIAELDVPDFRRRESAQRELAAMGSPARPLLRAALANSASAEVRRRAEALLALPDRPRGERLRTLRAIEILERIGTPAAREALTALAAGEADDSLTEQAKAALQRLNR